MRSSSNNCSQSKTIPFTKVEIHNRKCLSEDETGYESAPKDRIDSSGILSCSSSLSNGQYDRVLNLVSNIPSPTDVSTTDEMIEGVVTVAERIEQFSKYFSTSITPVRKKSRTKIKPIPDSTSDSADSFVFSNHLILVAPKTKRWIDRATNLSATINLPQSENKLEYFHDQRFDSNGIEQQNKENLIEFQTEEKQKESIVRRKLKFLFSPLTQLGQNILHLPPNLVATIFIGLTSGFFVSLVLLFIYL